MYGNPKCGQKIKKKNNMYVHIYKGTCIRVTRTHIGFVSNTFKDLQDKNKCVMMMLIMSEHLHHK